MHRDTHIWNASPPPLRRAKPAGSTAGGHAQFFPRPMVKNGTYYARNVVNFPTKNQL